MQYLNQIASLTPFVALFLSSSASAQSLLVVGPGGTHPTIQAAVNAAANGDVIEIVAGTYNEDVEIINKGLTLVCAGDPSAEIVGTLAVSDLAGADSFLAVNLIVQPENAESIGFLKPFAISIEDCAGQVRLQDMVVVGALGEVNDTLPYTSAPTAGVGLGVTDSPNVGLVDCTLDGGEGGPWGPIPFDGSHGGSALDVHGDSRLLVQRCVLKGGAGGYGENGGDGGSAARIFDTSEVIVAYSAFIGADGAGAFALAGGSGGDGLFVSAGARVDDFNGLYFGGYIGMGWMLSGPPPTKGQPLSGQGLVVPVISGHPSAIHAPGAVRVGDGWDLEVVGIPGELVHPLAGFSPSFRWVPQLRQPLMMLVNRVASVGLGTWQSFGSNGRTNYSQPAATLAPGQGASVLWIQARIVGGAARLTSARALVILR